MLDCRPTRRPAAVSSSHPSAAAKDSTASFDHLVTQNATPDPDGFLEFFSRELAEPMRALTPSS